MTRAYFLQLDTFIASGERFNHSTGACECYLDIMWAAHFMLTRYFDCDG